MRAFSSASKKFGKRREVRDPAALARRAAAAPAGPPAPQRAVVREVLKDLKPVLEGGPKVVIQARKKEKPTKLTAFRPPRVDRRPRKKIAALQSGR